MSILYTIALCVVFVAFIAVTLDAVLSVSRPKPWETPAAGLSVVATQDRRAGDLRYIGHDRRGAADSTAAEAAAAADADAARRAA